jgi:hypothetical protein
MMPPAIRLLVDLLQAPPPPEWWDAELDRLLMLFEERLDVPGYTGGEVLEHVVRARQHDPAGFDLDRLASELRGVLVVDPDLAVQEALLRLDVVLARFSHNGPSTRVGFMIARRLASPPACGLDDPEALLHLRREMGEITL